MPTDIFALAHNCSAVFLAVLLWTYHLHNIVANCIGSNMYSTKAQWVQSYYVVAVDFSLYSEQS